LWNDSLASIRIELPSVKIGIVEATGAHVELVNQLLAREMDEVCERIRRTHSIESLAEYEPIRAVRAMFHAWDMDPSKYRPSSEALLRRVVQGKGLYRVSNVVDAGNLGSVETGWPYGCYDRDRITGTIAFRHGRVGECYQGIGKRMWHLEGRPVLADDQGPFGSPISDSTRTMITESTANIWALIYAPQDAADLLLQQSMTRLGERFASAAGAQEISHLIQHRDDRM
jgi:DNA/RNA-binding domain of Phe-tRNA-synthetase-like protein